MKYTGQGKQNKPASWFLRFYDTTGAGEVTACLARVAKGSVELSKIITLKFISQFCTIQKVVGTAKR